MNYEVKYGTTPWGIYWGVWEGEDCIAATLNEVDAGRICACLNACEGLPTVKLPPGICKKLYGVLKEILNICEGGQK